MNRGYHKVISRFASVRFFSPGGFLACALVIAVTYAGIEALGLRSSATVLTGTSPLAGGWLALGPACLYLLCYLVFVGLVPILLLGAIFLLLLNLIISILRKKDNLL